MNTKESIRKDDKKSLPRVGFLTRVRTRFAEVTGCACRAEISGTQQVVLQGCRRILLYTDECIRMTVTDAHAKTVTVRGRNLTCLSYHTDAVVVEGVIDAVVFSAEENREDTAL